MISLTSPVRTPAHDWPAGIKLGLLCAASVLLFRLDGVAAQGLLFGGSLMLYALPGRIFWRDGLRRLLRLWPYILLLAIWHLFLREIEQGITIALRMINAVALANLVTMTTKLDEMIELFLWLANPLRWVGISPKVIALSFALVIRFVPVLAEKGTALSDAWRARSHRKPRARIIIPFTVLALDDAEQVADAIKARGGI